MMSIATEVNKLIKLGFTKDDAMKAFLASHGGAIAVPTVSTETRGPADAAIKASKPVNLLPESLRAVMEPQYNSRTGEPSINAKTGQPWTRVKTQGFYIEGGKMAYVIPGGKRDKFFACSDDAAILMSRKALEQAVKQFQELGLLKR